MQFFLNTASDCVYVSLSDWKAALIVILYTGSYIALTAAVLTNLVVAIMVDTFAEVGNKRK